MEKIYYNKEIQKVPIKSWVTDIESGALDQAKKLANLPFIFKHVALMPDCHQGYGMPIGGVIATKGYIIPNAVGVDIGCGMCAIKSNLNIKDFSTEQLKQVMGEIRKRVPIGFSHHQTPCNESEMPGKAIPVDFKIVSQEWTSALRQLGTLGGGNHFIEIQKDEEGFVWIMIHSGSRNLGKKVCDYYNKLAKERNARWHSKVPPSHDLAYLPTNCEEGKSYFEEMFYCLEFAKNNRYKMLDECIESFHTFLPDIEFGESINIHHNYAALENHFGENVIVHRKGATKATKGLKGIIPGSQGTSSYIVEGLGNPESFESCSHGAGRLMGRNDAKRNLNLEVEKKKLEDKGIVHSIRNASNLDEASGAYKDIDVVMENQKELVKIVVKLEPLGVIKG